jgi:hypothetical protein
LAIGAVVGCGLSVVGCWQARALAVRALAVRFAWSLLVESRDGN